MRILLSNDDGVHAPGIQTLAKALREFADVQVVAPDRNRSGASNSLTLESSLRTFTFENGDIAVQMGTPTDCVYLGVNALMRPRPDIVVSGINAGPNLGDDVIYSGTVAAAMEGRHLGFPALAVSLDGHKHYDTAAAVTCSIIPHPRCHQWVSPQQVSFRLRQSTRQSVAAYQRGHVHV